MRLHRLSVTAFGPFAGTQTVDFDALTRNGLFLLHGPTGAGKTAVLDAVCYALYGSVPGARQGNPLRSDHAGSGTPTAVALELTLGGRRLEIARSPGYGTPKKQGGTGKVQAKTLLREWNAAPRPGWSAVSSSNQEVGEEIHQLLGGMSREQFCQVVLLPQGDFARFLRADAAQRAAVLGRLFDTRRYRDAEDWLGRRRRETSEAARSAVDAILGTVHRLYQAAGRQDPPPDADGSDWAALAGSALETAARLRTDARERHEHAVIAVAGAERRHSAAERLAERARVVAERQARHAAAVARATALDQAADEHRHLAGLLERSRRAAPAVPLLGLARRARSEQAEAARAESRARAALPGTAAGAGRERLEEAEAELRQELARLAELDAVERQYHRMAGDRERLRHELAASEEEREEAARWLADWPSARTAAAARVEETRDAAVLADRLAEQADRARAQQDAARLAGELDERVAEAEAEEHGARERAVAAHERWNDARQRRLDGMAAELAAGLAPGAGCPVCGSTEHPAPAAPGPGHITRDDEDTAERDHRAAQEARDALARRVRDLRERAAAAGAASGGVPAAKLAEVADRLAEEHEAARTLAAAAVEAAQRLDRLEAEHAGRLAAEQRAAGLTAARTARLEDLTRDQRQLADRLAEARGGDAGIAERAARLRLEAQRLSVAASAARTARETGERAARAEAEAEAAAREAGFAGAAEAAAAVLDETRAADLQGRLDRYREQRAEVRAVVDDPDTAAASAGPAADPAAARDALDTATAGLRRAAAAEAAARSRRDELAALGRRLAAQATAIAPLVEEHTATLRLANLAAGTAADNALRMRLESYVLAARLEQVAAAASARLERMSSGRYTLVHSDERVSGTKRSGLGLQVVDAWTGRARDTATLSGGESFFTSLALALGLADVVTFEAGGIRLDTLFIDEGFGSLDPQALDDVLDVLDGLRERDRAVGIVSHVPELRQRIPTQLRVIRGRHGSTVRGTGTTAGTGAGTTRERVPGPARTALPARGGRPAGR